MFHFYTPPADFSREKSAYIATLAGGLSSVKALLTDVGLVLQFPPHAGKNFDALWDGIRSLRPEAHKIILVHQDLPCIPGEDLATYLDLLGDALRYWQDHAAEHRFEVWFPEQDESAIKALLQAPPPPEQ